MKKKIFFLSLCLLTLFVAGSFAQQEAGTGGFRGPAAGITTVEQANRLRDDTPVVMRGRIVSFLGGDRYLFTDDTGSITLEIERRVWGNLSVDENDLVEISGEVDRNRRRVEIEVRRIRIVG